MLVLSRRRGEEICIGNDIRIKILSINDDESISIGFTAPRDVEIHRLEVYRRIWGIDKKPPESE